MPESSDERIRLMKFVTVFGCGGTERQVVNLGLAIDTQRFALEIACMKRWGQFLADVEGRGFAVNEFPMRSLGSGRAVWQLLRLARRMAQRSVQIVHTYNFYANVFAIPAAWIAGTPVIIASIRDRGVYLSPAQRRVQRQVCRLADCVLVNAESIKEWLVDDGYDAERVIVIRNGIDAGRFAVSRRPGLRDELGLPAEAPIVTMMSRLIPMKGLEDFIDAAAFVSWHRPDVRFLIVGEGTAADHGTYRPETAYRQTIVDRIRRLGLNDRVILTGYRADVPALLAETAVSVLPSLSEGLSNVLLEAMAAGVPVVATRVGGTPEVIDHGVTGLLVPPGDPQGLADAIGGVVDDPSLAARLGAAGRQSVRERFGIDRMVHATEQVYLDLLVRKAAQPDWRRRIGLAPPVVSRLSRRRS
jgi:glycosyltransferase involved in cell wall biosynthesis